MKGIKGQLSSLSITDLMQWIEMNKKTGVLFVSRGENNKCFCFKGGKLLLASSKDGKEKFGQLLARNTGLGREDIVEAISKTMRGRGSFVSYLIQKKQVRGESVSEAVKVLAERNIMDILSWGDGFFEFIEDLPPMLAGSPVEIAAGFIVFEAVRKYDELSKHGG